MVTVDELDGELVLVVEDDGRGFPTERLGERLADGHVGLATQSVRIEAADGTMDVESRAGEGTRVEIRLPVDR
jgi:two-component system NarL family sensor kinase